jgi:aminoglycoside 3-N-acetyltransferase
MWRRSRQPLSPCAFACTADERRATPHANPMRGKGSTVWSIDAETIEAGLRALQVRSGGIVLFHAALSAFGHVEGGALAVIAAMEAAVGPRGTVVAPTLTGRPSDGPDSPPVFDRDATPCWTGRVPETFRTLPGTIRSLHPTHSVTARGPKAGWLTGGHLDAPSPCGIGTPYARLVAEGGQVVLFGVDLNACTLVHCLEEVAGVPYHLQSTLTPVAVRAGGTVYERAVRLHVWDNRWKEFNRLALPAHAAGALRRRFIGPCRTTVIDAERFFAVGVARLLEDPWFLVRPPETRLAWATLPLDG